MVALYMILRNKEKEKMEGFLERFIVDHITKNRMYVLFAYLKRVYALEDPGPFSIDTLDKSSLKDKAILRVSDKNRGFLYDLEISDSYILIENFTMFKVKFDLSSFSLVMDYGEYGYNIYLASKEKDEKGRVNNILNVFSDTSNGSDSKDIDIEKVKTYFEWFADNKEFI